MIRIPIQQKKSENRLIVSNLGQLRRSSNSAPANLAEGWNNKHIRMYLEGINRPLAELRETKHHLTVAFGKGYFDETVFQDLSSRYDECGKMLRGLEQSLEKFKR